MPYFCFFNNIRPQPYLSCTLCQHFQHLSHTLLQYFKQIKAPAVPYIRNFNRITLQQQYLISPFSMEKTPAVLYFCILNKIRPLPYLSCTLFWHFQQYDTPAVPYFSILNRLKPQPYLIQHFQQNKHQQYLISPFSMKKTLSHTLFLHFQQTKTPPVPQSCLILALSII